MKPNTLASVFDRVDRSGGETSCWPYLGARTSRGYGRHPYGNKMKRAHRLAYEATHGEIPTGLLVCHRCDNPPCCNPAHLFLGTSTDNVADCTTKGRRALGEAHPRAKLTAQAVREIRESRQSMLSLSRRYGVSDMTIRSVVLGKSWTSVE